MHSTHKSKLYCGADLHGNNVFLSICDEEGKTVFKRRIKNDLELLLQTLAPFKDQLVDIGVESTFNWYWFVDGLMDNGYPVSLGNPAMMDQYDGIKVTDDKSDAAWLAEMLRLGIFPSCYIYPKEVRSLRDLLRRRVLISKQHTQCVLSVKSLLERYGLGSPSSAQLDKWTLQTIEQLNLDHHVKLQLNYLLEGIHQTKKTMAGLERDVLAELKPTEQYKRLQQVPGLGRILASLVALESGEPSRFKTASNYASYCRTVRSQRDSNNKKKGTNNAKNGNPYLAWAFIEAATCAIRSNPRIQAWYEKKKQRCGLAVKAKKALACKLAKAAWYVMNGEDYDKTKLFG
jgi:transposase